MIARGVVAASAEQEVVARAAIEEVVAALAVEPVIAGEAGQLVVPAAAIDVVGGAGAADRSSPPPMRAPSKLRIDSTSPPALAVSNVRLMVQSALL